MNCGIIALNLSIPAIMKINNKGLHNSYYINSEDINIKKILCIYIYIKPKVMAECVFDVNIYQCHFEIIFNELKGVSISI